MIRITTFWWALVPETRSASLRYAARLLPPFSVRFASAARVRVVIRRSRICFSTVAVLSAASWAAKRSLTRPLRARRESVEFVLCLRVRQLAFLPLHELLPLRRIVGVPPAQLG